MRHKTAFITFAVLAAANSYADTKVTARYIADGAEPGW